ncbi:winged helix DNA-binding protein [Lysinibacillus fusiformis]|uniref:winged helix DNA-binding protein n=1 Tax=Lysinibacillus fusiformis TaxID=28031 RepID=UPI0023A9DE37|nr:winged helix DNA-binding protein [Lysinibacillus fusiformis]WEA41251.1 winged helix DNA-binding protein [Lysinibacillus fusiformis]
MGTQILNQFKEYLEKQDMLNKLTESQMLNDFGYSEIHTITAIGDLKEPNVTLIAKELNMTRGAISKITKKLVGKKLIETYMIPDNKQKVFFKLTEEGEVLYLEHDKRHKEWEERDLNFFSQFSNNQIELISKFMTSYILYLDSQIKIIEKSEEDKND